MTYEEAQQELKELKSQYQNIDPSLPEAEAIKKKYEQLTELASQLKPTEPIEELSRSLNPEPSKESALLRENYLRRLFHATSQLYLTGIDRKTASDGTETWLNLSAIYVALWTRHWGGTALNQLSKNDRLVLLGDPGSGKSTFVKFVAMCLAGDLLNNKSVNLLLLEKDSEEWGHGALLPVLVILRDFAARGLPPEGKRAKASHLWNFIANALSEDMLNDYASHLQRHLQEQGGLLLLDGLDEVPEAMKRREQIKQAVEDFALAFPKCRILVTSRTYAYQKQNWRLKEFNVAELAAFTKEQIHLFVDHWYAHFAEKRRVELNDARGKAELLKLAIFHSKRLTELAERPLLLTLIASLHAWRGGSLPEKREELYNDTVDLLLDWWESPKIVRDTDGNFIIAQRSLSELLKVGKERVRKALNSVAFLAHHSQEKLEGTADISEDQLIGALMRFSQNKELRPALLVDYLNERAGLLIPRGVGVYTFPHRTFQEYLAACYLTDDNYPKKLAELSRQEPNRWREVLFLAGSKAARGASSAIWLLAEALCWREIEQVDPTPEMAWGALLAAQALSEIIELNQVEYYDLSKLERINHWLMAILTKRVPSGNSFPTVERSLADNILAKLDIREGIRIDENELPDICWCEVPAGEFIMGEGRNEHKIHISAFQMSRYLVTYVQYQIFIEYGGYTDTWRECWTSEGWGWRIQHNITGPKMYRNPFNLPNHPIVGVSWYEASAFCQWLTFQLRERDALSGTQEIRLPTEAEWEKAARGPDARIFPWGNSITPELANYGETEMRSTTPVGCFPKGVSPYGCDDMSGNVWEWCLDWYDFEYYTKTPVENPPGAASGSLRILRGGFWDDSIESCRAAYRHGCGPEDRSNFIGFRLLKASL